MARVPQIKSENYKLLDINLCVKADWNYKTNEESLRAALRESIKRDGQIESIQVRVLPTGFYEVVNGNHRLDEMKDLGYEKVFVYDHGVISDAKARLLATQTNDVRFSIDTVKYSQLLKDITAEIKIEDISLVLAKTSEEIKQHIGLLDFSMDDFKKDSSAPSEESSFQKIVINVPKQVAEQFYAQLDRIKIALYPEENPEDVSEVLPLECMIQHIAQIDDKQLVG